MCDFLKSVNPDTLITSDGQIPLAQPWGPQPRPPIGPQRLKVNLGRVTNHERRRDGAGGRAGEAIDSFPAFKSLPPALKPLVAEQGSALAHTAERH